MENWNSGISPLGATLNSDFDYYCAILPDGTAHSDGGGTVAGSLRVSDPKEHSENPWGVSLPLLGADVVVPQTRESDASMGRGGVVLYGVARSESTGVNRGG